MPDQISGTVVHKTGSGQQHVDRDICLGPVLTRIMAEKDMTALAGRDKHACGGGGDGRQQGSCGQPGACRGNGRLRARGCHPCTQEPAYDKRPKTNASGRLGVKQSDGH